MKAYTAFLTAMCLLFVTSGAVLLLSAAVQFTRRRGRKAAVYLGLTLLSCVVAAGFYFFRGLL
jgi:Na+/melibiose symporter-like transporter